MLAIADYDFFDFLEGAGIDADTASSYGIAAVGAIFSEFEGVTVFKEQNFSGDAAELIGEGGVAEEMTVLTVNGDEIFRLHKLQDEFLFFLAGVARDVNGAGGVVVVDQGAAAEHVIEHADNGFVGSGGDASGAADG